MVTLGFLHNVMFICPLYSFTVASRKWTGFVKSSRLRLMVAKVVEIMMEFGDKFISGNVDDE